VYIRADIRERSGAMKMQIGRWGNSLAVRLPKALVDRFRLKEGDEVDSEAIEAALARSEADERRRDSALERIKALRRPLPPDYKFDRDEANAR
jgi:antitoxin MazE